MAKHTFIADVTFNLLMKKIPDVFGTLEALL